MFEGNSGTSKIRVLPSGTSPQTMDLENFASGKSILLTTKLVDGRACGSHLQCSARRGWAHIVYYTSVDCNPLTPLLRFVLDLLHRCAAVDKISTDILDLASVCGSRASCFHTRNANISFGHHTCYRYEKQDLLFHLTISL